MKSLCFSFTAIILMVFMAAIALKLIYLDERITDLETQLKEIGFYAHQSP